jgi:hypothetical protein
MVDVPESCSGGDDPEAVSDEESVDDGGFEDPYDGLFGLFAEGVCEWVVGDCQEIRLMFIRSIEQSSNRKSKVFYSILFCFVTRTKNILHRGLGNQGEL